MSLEPNDALGHVGAHTNTFHCASHACDAAAAAHLAPPPQSQALGRMTMTGTTPTAALTAGDLDLTVLRQHLMPCDINMSISLPQARHGLVVDYAWLDHQDGSSLELVGRREGWLVWCRPPLKPGPPVRLVHLTNERPSNAAARSTPTLLGCPASPSTYRTIHPADTLGWMVCIVAFQRAPRASSHEKLDTATGQTPITKPKEWTSVRTE